MSEPTISQLTGTTIISSVLTGCFQADQSCTLVFEPGGRIDGSLEGDNTKIIAPPIQIFGTNAIITGSFNVECAYPEWWGAKTVSLDDTSPFNSAPAIQRAFDSQFGLIRFCSGVYYVAATDPSSESILRLTNMKAIELQGHGSLTGTTIRTDQNKDLLVVYINAVNYGIFSLTGGCFDMSGVSRLSHSAIFMVPTGEWGGLIQTTIKGPLTTIAALSEEYDGLMEISSSSITAAINTRHGAFMGIGIHFSDSDTHVPTLKDSGNSWYLCRVDCDIDGFGQSFVIDHDRSKVVSTTNSQGETTSTTVRTDITSIELTGRWSNAFRHLFAPSRGLNGGFVKGTIILGDVNTNDSGYHGALLDGNLTDAIIDVPVLNSDCSLANCLPGLYAHMSGYVDSEMSWVGKTDRVGFGSRAIAYIDFLETKDRALLASAETSSTLGAMGHFDLQQLSAVSSYIGPKNYVHIIDNDLWYLDRINGSVTVDVFDYDVRLAEHSHTMSGVTANDDSSLFGPLGLALVFGTSADNVDARLSIVTTIPPNYPIQGLRLQFMALHLKNRAYNHFNKLTCILTNDSLQDITVFSDLSYANIPVTNTYDDIIIPTMETAMKLRTITLIFSEFVHVSNVWGGEHFRVAIEGRFNRHASQSLHSAGSAVLSAPMTVGGKPFLLGEKQFSTFGDLPFDAAPGAMAVVTGNRPVTFSGGKWWFNNLTGNSAFFTTDIAQLLGEGLLSVGQRAYLINGNTKKPIWWNGIQWVNAAGNSVIF